MTERNKEFEFMKNQEASSENIPNLDQTVLYTLDFFTKNPPPRINVSEFKSPFVVGSGNAFNTGAILFSEKDAILADESDFKAKFASSDKKSKDGSSRDVVVISASGGKDSVWEVELAKQNGLKTTLLTTKEHSDAAKIADKVYVYKSIAEPYTYNTSTYMGMILSATGEDPAKIKSYIESLKFPQNFNDYKFYAFVVPDKFKNICPMLDIKDGELFGPYSAVRAFPQGHARHAKFVIRAEDEENKKGDKVELVISLGQKNEHFGDPTGRWDVDLPSDINFAGIMAATYYIVGKIQASKPPYFKNNIRRYVNEDGPKAYGPNAKPFDLIVPGSN